MSQKRLYIIFTVTATTVFIGGIVSLFVTAFMLPWNDAFMWCWIFYPLFMLLLIGGTLTGEEPRTKKIHDALNETGFLGAVVLVWVLFMGLDWGQIVFLPVFLLAAFLVPIVILRDRYWRRWEKERSGPLVEEIS